MARSPVAPSAPARKPPPRRIANEVRIIGGQWKRTRLPVADKPGLRPTPDRVRETLFNWLGQELGGWRCVDAFAGTGALGLEAASRGAAQVLLVEQDPALVAGLRALQARLEAEAVRIERADGISVLQRLAPGVWDLVLLDPPFDAGLYDKALAAAARLLAAGGHIYLEAPLRWTEAQLEPFGLVPRRHLKAGAVHAHLLQRRTSAES
ncbi:MAG TPA: 16S rRNA (guanine(966)-N(2))-methyltransferase RsmD [Ramlibacter sp.]|nr:16S rRNA (guanine(966)-N(2))-methyltransferase RsmD [Ramlibacter sp.]